MKNSDDDASFLGTGWNFPPCFSLGGSDVQRVSGAEDIEQSLHILLKTALGERVMREEFGCELSSFVFEEISQNMINNLIAMITNAVLYYETRITLNSVLADESNDIGGLLIITIDYTIRSTNSRFNMVYPFYLNEVNQAYV